MINKIKIIFLMLLITLVFMLSINIKSFAAYQPVVEFKGNTYTLPDISELATNKYNMIRAQLSGSQIIFWLHVADSVESFGTIPTNHSTTVYNYNYLLAVKPYPVAYQYILNAEDGSVISDGWTEYGEVSMYQVAGNDNIEVISSNFTMYYDNGEVFYQPPEGLILAPIVEETPLEEVMKEIVTVLPVVLVTIVGLISLRKGLRVLSTVLHRS